MHKIDVNNPHIPLTEWKHAPEEERKAWVQSMYDHGATMCDIGLLWGISCPGVRYYLKPIKKTRSGHRRPSWLINKFWDFVDKYDQYKMDLDAGTLTYTGTPGSLARAIVDLIPPNANKFSIAWMCK